MATNGDSGRGKRHPCLEDVATKAATAQASTVTFAEKEDKRRLTKLSFYQRPEALLMLRVTSLLKRIPSLAR